MSGVEFLGINWGTPFQGGILGVMAALLAVNVRAYIVGAPARKQASNDGDKIATDREANLLTERAEEMAGMRERLTAIEGKLEAKERQIEAERTMYRHRISNLGQAFHALLMLLKKNVPVEEAVEEIERMRAEQLAREVAEAAMFRAAGLHIDALDPGETNAMANAKRTKRATGRADESAQAGVDEVRRSEEGGK